MSKWIDLAPDIFRQRLIIEGTTEEAIHPDRMSSYLIGLADAIDMVAYSSPSLSHHEDYGWCCHMHWVTSGAQMYTWDNRCPCFFSVDIYTCKSFDVLEAKDYTESFFTNTLIGLIFKEI